MARVKGGFTTRRRHKRVLKMAKGYFGARGRLFKTARKRLTVHWSMRIAIIKHEKETFVVCGLCASTPQLACTA